MHLVYISTLKQDYIGQSEIAAAQLMEQVVSGNLPVKLEEACLLYEGVNKQGQPGMIQRPLIATNWFTANLYLSTRHIVDIRTIGKDSPLRKTFKSNWKKARAENSGITLVKTMPKDLPTISNN